MPQHRLPVQFGIRRAGTSGSVHRHDVAEADAQEPVAAGQAEGPDGEVASARRRARGRSGALKLRRRTSRAHSSRASARKLQDASLAVHRRTRAASMRPRTRRSSRVAYFSRARRAAPSSCRRRRCTRRRPETSSASSQPSSSLTQPQAGPARAGSARADDPCRARVRGAGTRRPRRSDTSARARVR